MAFDPSSRARLTAYDLDRFPGNTLFDRLGRAVCQAGCLPRKEFFEVWEVARRVRRLFRGGRVIDLAAGHGLLGAVMLVLDDSSPHALAVDTALSPCGAKVRDVLSEGWPRIAGRMRVVEGALGDVEIGGGDVVVALHACGALTDRVLDRAAEARARVAVVPCCQDDSTCDAGDLTGWLQTGVAVDVLRAIRLRDRGYRIWTARIPLAITPQNRLLMGAPL